LLLLGGESLLQALELGLELGFPALKLRDTVVTGKHALVRGELLSQSGPVATELASRARNRCKLAELAEGGLHITDRYPLRAAELSVSTGALLLSEKLIEKHVLAKVERTGFAERTRGVGDSLLHPLQSTGLTDGFLTTTALHRRIREGSQANRTLRNGEHCRLIAGLLLKDAVQR